MSTTFIPVVFEFVRAFFIHFHYFDAHRKTISESKQTVCKEKKQVTAIVAYAIAISFFTTKSNSVVFTWNGKKKNI